MNNVRMQIASISALLLVSACSTVGEKDFACPGRPAGVRCMSATEVYNATHTAGRVEATSAVALGDDPAKAEKSRAKTAKADDKHAGHSHPQVPAAAPPAPAVPAPAQQPNLLVSNTLIPAAQKPIPIRTPAQVMRVWIAPWENSGGVLKGGGYGFIEVESRRWIVGESDPSVQPVRYFSIQNAKVDSKEPVGKGQSEQKAASAGSSERAKRPNSSLSN